MNVTAARWAARAAEVGFVILALSVTRVVPPLSFSARASATVATLAVLPAASLTKADRVQACPTAAAICVACSNWIEAVPDPVVVPLKRMSI